MSEIKINFSEFQKICRFARPGIKDNSNEFELTCRREDNIPQGHSWGRCNERNCPFFGIEIIKGELRDEKTGEVIMVFGPGALIHEEEL